MPAPEVRALFDEALALGGAPHGPAGRVPRRRRSPARSADAIGAGEERLSIPGIGRLWGRLGHVGAGICTVGEAIEDRVRALFDARELPLAVMLDSVGSAAAESLAEYANDLLCQRAIPAGLKVTNRVSPGYAGWDTSEQQALFRLCSGAPIGVRLNAACFMTPAKSISLLVGHRSRGAGRPLLQPVPALLDARLRLPAGARRGHGASLSPDASARIGPGMDNVILVGFMGAGKSSVGRLLARRLGRCFVETDDMITAREGRPIPEIFAERGEAHFRALEDEALALLAQKRGDVIATGGGLPCREGRPEALRALGTVVWLAGDFDVIYDRARAAGERPMLAGRTRQEWRRSTRAASRTTGRRT